MSTIEDPTAEEMNIEDTVAASGTAPEATSTPHKASTPRTKEALRVFKSKSGLCEVETCEQKSVDPEQLCQNHLENGIEAPSEPAKRGRKRKPSGEELEEEDSRKKAAWTVCFRRLPPLARQRLREARRRGPASSAVWWTAARNFEPRVAIV